MKRLIREPAVCDRLGVGPTTLEERYIKTGRLRWVRIGKRIKAAVEDEVDAIVERSPGATPRYKRLASAATPALKR
jgi:predicted site-specific integrase-resolvase